MGFCRVITAAVLTTLASAPLAAGGITIDGQTPTSITAGPGGSTTVKIAPANRKGHSRNTYSAFNVEKPGVVLDNSAVGAGLILNEVTSNAFSRIEGQLSVRGPRADVVIANPNGIAVNGGRFVNTGRVGLIAGRRAGSDANGLPRYQLGTGEISVGAGGVLSQTGSLHLAAPLLRIDGPVVAAADADVQMIAGRGVATVGDQSAAGWMRLQHAGQGGRILLSSGARLSGGAITMQATGAGAQVVVGGQVLAQAGNFILTSDGRVQITGTHRASKTLSVAGQDVDIGGSSLATSLTSTDEAVQLRASGDLALRSVKIKGGGQGFFGFDTQASVGVLADGAATLDNVSLRAQSGSIEIITGKTLSFAGLSANAGTDILLSSKTGLTAFRSSFAAGEALRFESDAGDLTLTRTNAVADLSLIAQGGNITLSSDDAQRNSLRSTQAGVLLEARSNLRNDGMLVQGRRKIQGSAASVGAVTLKAGGDLTLSSLSETAIGVFYAQNSNLTATATGDIENRSGRFLADTSLLLRAGGALRNAVAQTNEDVAGLMLPGEGFVSFGQFTAGREVGEITAKQTVQLFARSIQNHGGEITGERVELRAHDISNQPERFGWQRYRKVCLFAIFCRRTASGAIFHDGGTITATGTLDIKATGQMTQTGGSMSGGDLLRIEAPDVSLSAFRFYEFFERRSGIAALFRGKHAVRVANYTTGTLVSENGDVEVISLRPVYNEQTQIAARGEVTMPKGTTSLGFAESISALNARRLGIFRWITSGVSE